MSDPFFSGYENMVYVEKFLGNSLKGVSVTAEESGFCEMGCFAYGSVQITNGKYQKLNDIPFKAAMDDSHYYDASTKTFYIQASYDLRDPSEWCAPSDSDLCLLALDSDTGKLKSALYTANFTIYKYADVPSEGKFEEQDDNNICQSYIIVHSFIHSLSN